MKYNYVNTGIFQKNELKLPFKSWVMWTVGSLKAPHPHTLRLNLKMNLAALGTKRNARTLDK